MIIIPTCFPGIELIKLIDELIAEDISLKDKIIIINDHSNNSEAELILNTLESKGLKIINNSNVKGKGSAIKKGIEYSTEHKSEYVVIADSDGQHKSKDIINIMKVGIEYDKFIIGSRNFDQKIPLRNRLGNKISSYLYFLITNYKIKDCQCGLRYVPNRYFNLLLEIEASNFDFEMYSLYQIMQKEEIKKVNIETIYSKENYITNYRIILDSFKILIIFFKIIVNIKRKNKKIHK